MPNSDRVTSETCKWVEERGAHLNKLTTEIMRHSACHSGTMPQMEIYPTIRVSMETLQSAECGRAIEMRYAR